MVDYIYKLSIIFVGFFTMLRIRIGQKREGIMLYCTYQRLLVLILYLLLEFLVFIV